MDQKQIIKQMLDFNQKYFDNAFDFFSTMQDQTESYVSRFMEKSTWITPEGKKLVSQMADAYRKGRSDFKSLAEENYRKSFEYFVPADKRQ